MLSTLKERDVILEKMWDLLEDVPMEPYTERLQESFCCFPVGTQKEEILHWFDDRHSKGVVYLMYGTPHWEHNGGESAFYKCIKEEVGTYLQENYGVDPEKCELYKEMVDRVWNDVDLVCKINDRIAEHIDAVLEDHDLETLEAIE